MNNQLVPLVSKLVAKEDRDRPKQQRHLNDLQTRPLLVLTEQSFQQWVHCPIPLTGER